jgi:hypothetical protein
MTDIFKDNLSAQKIIRNKINQANKLKYNFSVNHEAENMSGDPNDRTEYDAGNDPRELSINEKINEN